MRSRSTTGPRSRPIAGTDPAVRLLTRERRRGRRDRHDPRPRCGSGPGRHPGARARADGAPIHVELATTSSRRPPRSVNATVVRSRRASACSQAGLTPADVDVAQIVEPFTLRGPARTRAIRVLRPGRRWAFHPAAPRSGPTARCRSTRTVARTARRSCTASTTCRKRCAICAAPRPIKRGRRGCLRVRRDQRPVGRGVARSRPVSSTHPDPIPPTPTTRGFGRRCRRAGTRWAAALRGLRGVPASTETRAARCGSTRSGWEPSASSGEVWSFTVTHPPTSPAFADETPTARSWYGSTKACSW